MKFPLSAALALVLTLSACGGIRESRLNPLNWFGRSEAAQAVDLAEQDVDPRPLAEQIVDLTVDRMPGGAIIRATALPPTQGFWDAALVERADPANPDLLVLEFRMVPPPERAAVSTPRSRQVTAAMHVSDIRLANITGITVQGATNGLSARR